MCQWYGLKCKTHLVLSFTTNPRSNSWDLQRESNKLHLLLERVAWDHSHPLKKYKQIVVIIIIIIYYSGYFLSWKPARCQLFPDPSWPPVDHQGIMIIKGIAVHSWIATWALMWIICLQIHRAQIKLTAFVTNNSYMCPFSIRTWSIPYVHMSLRS